MATKLIIIFEFPRSCVIAKRAKLCQGFGLAPKSKWTVKSQHNCVWS